MKWLTPEQRIEVQRIASKNPEQETCGFVLLDGSVTEAQNIAIDPVQNFEISPQDYLAADERGVAGVWHSHLTLDAFSPLDQQVMAADTLPWAVYCLRNGSFTECEPGVVAPLLGRPFCFGTYDCYSLISDKLAELNVVLPEWPRGKYGEWNEAGFAPFDEQAEAVGRPVRDGIYQEGDILLMNLGDHSGHSDHVGVFLDHVQFLHHPAERLSRIDRFGSWWKRRTRLVLRPNSLWTN